MSNRMRVLSRRLERFAVGFSIAIFAFFLIGFFAAANTERQIVFFIAGLVAVCLFATFFLWLAHGFAWAMIPEDPIVAKKLAEAMKPIEAMKPAEAIKPVEAMKPVEAIKPEAMKPVEAMKPTEEKKAADAMKAAEEKKPAEEEMIAPENPADAKYTITGRRVY